MVLGVSKMKAAFSNGENQSLNVISTSVTSHLKASIYLNLSEILKCLRRDRRKKMLTVNWNTKRQLTPTQEHRSFTGDCFGAHLLIFNFKNYMKYSIFRISRNYANSLRKTFLSQTSLKYHPKICKTPQNIDS